MSLLNKYLLEEVMSIFCQKMKLPTQGCLRVYVCVVCVCICVCGVYVCI
jgi:hypothetical protein